MKFEPVENVLDFVDAYHIGHIYDPEYDAFFKHLGVVASEDYDPPGPVTLADYQLMSARLKRALTDELLPDPESKLDGSYQAVLDYILQLDRHILVNGNDPGIDVD